MKSIRLLVLLLLVGVSSARAQEFDGLRIKIECEEPSGIFLDRETIEVRRSILFSVHLFNETNQPRQATLNWRIRDAGGKIVMAGEEKSTLAAGGHISRRELFLPTMRGGFVLSADGFSRRDGPDLKAEGAFPFAIIATPPGPNARPFLLLEAPFALSEKELDAFARLGVRALRTFVPPDSFSPGDDGWRDLDQAMQMRARHGLATVGVLRAPAGAGPRQSRDDEEWLQAALLTIDRVPSIRTWEIIGEAAPDTISEVARAARNMNPSRGIFAAASDITGDLKKLQPIDGLLYYVRSGVSASHPAAYRRALLGTRSRARENGLPTFHVRNAGAVQPDEDRTALEAARLLTTQTVLALATGAQSVSTTFARLRQGRTGMVTGYEFDHETFARGAAFAALNTMLGEAEFRTEIFPTSPLAMGAVFGKENGGAVAVLWTADGVGGKAQKAKLEALLGDAQVFDLFGNLLTEASKKKVVEIPFEPLPVFVTTGAAPEALERALREAVISGLDPLAAQVLPITQPLEYSGSDKPKDNKFAPASKLALRVRLHNTGVGPASGTLKIGPPPSWKLNVSTQQFNLNPGESRIYAFDVSQVKPNNEYPVKVEATGVVQSGGKTIKGSWGWNQKAMLTTATNVSPLINLQVDGSLQDWKSAHWMELENKTSDGKKINARLALRWDASRLYVAARVREPNLAPRGEDGEYLFWRRTDAIQLGFGLRDAAWMQPGSTPFRDTDYGFLLSPFHVRPDGTTDARILRLWSPQVPFGGVFDRVRWGGAVPGGRLEIRRDERGGETLYEAAIPLSEMPELNPSARLASEREYDSPMRFSWILHNDEGEKLQWSQSTNVFDWWANSGSFLPVTEFSEAAQTLLGFAQSGELGSGELSTPPAPLPLPPPPSVTTPLPLPPAPAEENLPPYSPTTTTPAPRPTPRPAPAAPPSRTLPNPVPIEPIPGDLLPPAPPPD